MDGEGEMINRNRAPGVAASFYGCWPSKAAAGVSRSFLGALGRKFGNMHARFDASQSFFFSFFFLFQGCKERTVYEPFNLIIIQWTVKKRLRWVR